jgi:hypothetical protein
MIKRINKMKIRTELKKDYKELYNMLKQENRLDWFEKFVKCIGSIDGTLKKMNEIVEFQ